jgi:hypothetical protein
LLTGTGHGILFVAGAVTEVGFGVVSSSMPALNHILITGRFTRWFPSWSNNSKSFKMSFFDYSSGTSRDIRRTDKIHVCKDEFRLDSVYLGEDFKYTDPRYAGRDLESDVGGKIYYLRFGQHFSHQSFRLGNHYYWTKFMQRYQPRVMVSCMIA